jgi:hypothetical protein
MVLMELHPPFAGSMNPTIAFDTDPEIPAQFVS